MHTLERESSERESSRLTKDVGFALRAPRMNGRRLPIAFAVAFTLVTPWGPVAAQRTQSDPQDQIQAGSKTYAQRCATCHGQRMQNPDAEVGAFDLRYFPRDEHDRFVSSVTGGKNAMPAWGGLISPAEIEALWAYICAGEK